MTATAARRLKIIEDISGSISKDSKILDFGCGLGTNVRELREMGYDAYGFDIYPTYGGVDYREDEQVKPLYEQGILRYVTLDDYSFPFDDDNFDIIISDEVLEHVDDYDMVLKEMYRVTRKGGRSLHMFPSRYRIIEAHCYVPYSSIIQKYWYLKLWAILGLRNEYQKGLNSSEAAEHNLKTLVTGTNYLSKKQIVNHVESVFGRCSFNELSALKHSSKKCYYNILKCIPLSREMISTMVSRTLYFEKQ